jgi:signal transduction histidine kinase
MLAEVVARLVSAGLDQVNLEEMLQEQAATGERTRLSRDLHDGLLQSLGGLAMHAEGVRLTAEADPRGAAGQLKIVVEQLVEAQRSLRDFVDELRPELAVSREPLQVRLERAARAIERQWNVAVDLRAEVEALPPRQAGDVVALVTEAATNAAKHSGATNIRGSVSMDGTSVRLHVEDDGRGFPFRGRYELAQLLADGRGSWSLNERVAALGGELAIESTGHGSRVEVRLPRPS